MRKVLVAIVAIVSMSILSTASLAADDYSGFVKQLPDFVKGALGTETITLNIAMSDGTTKTMGIKTEKGEVTGTQDSAYPNPTMAIYVSADVIDKIRSSGDPISVIKEEWGKGIRLEGLTLGNQIKFFFLDIMARLFFLFSGGGAPAGQAGTGGGPAGLYIINDVKAKEQFNAVVSKYGGTLFAAWVDGRNDPSGMSFQIHSAKSTDGGATWSTNVKVNGAPAPSADKDMRWPAILAVSSSQVYVAYQSSQDRGVWLASSMDGGSTWASAKVNGRYSNWADNLRLCHFNNVPIVLMDYGTATYASNPTANGWDEPTYLANSWGNPSCAATSKRLFVVTMNSSGYWPILWSTSDGKTFAKTGLINIGNAYNKGMYLASRGDVLYLAFANTTETSGMAIDGYWLTSSTDGGQTWSAMRPIGNHEYRGYTADQKLYPELFIDGDRFGLCYLGPGYYGYLTSTDSGVTWGTDQVITPQLQTKTTSFTISRLSSKCMFDGSDILFAGTWNNMSTNEAAVARNRLSTCTPNWSCTAWTGCINGKDTRKCTDLNGCGSDSGKPHELEVCGSLSKNCTDTDKQYEYEKGTCTDIGGKYTDRCGDANTLLEYYCMSTFGPNGIPIGNSFCAFETVSLPGYKCVDGALVK